MKKSTNSNGAPTEGIRFEKITVTPELASVWLEKNDGNRSITRSHLRFLTKQMADGKWKLTGEPIQFSDTGRLIDGQTRLNAVIESKTTQDFMVAFNVPDAHQAVIDTGKNRSAGDVLNMSGINNHTIAAAMIKAYMRFRQNISSYGGDKRYVSSNQDVLEEYSSQPELYSKTTLASQRWYKNSQQIMPASIIGGYYLLLREKGCNNTDQPVRDFFEKLFIGANLDADSVIMAFRKQLLYSKMNKVKIPSKELFNLFIYVWNMHLDGKTVKKLKAPEETPLIKPANSNMKIEFPDAGDGNEEGSGDEEMELETKVS